jgi:hypothetical protein
MRGATLPWFISRLATALLLVIVSAQAFGAGISQPSNAELAPVYHLGDLPLLKSCPDFYPEAQLQQENRQPRQKIVCKTSKEIHSNFVGTTPPRLPRSESYDLQPFKRIHLIDGDHDTLWINRGQALPNVQPEWVRIDLPYEMFIKQVTIWPLKPEDGGWPEDITLQVSRDGVNWNTVYHTSNHAPLSGYGPVNLPFQTQPIKQVLLTVKNLREVKLAAAAGSVGMGYGFCISDIDVLDANGVNVALLSRGAGVTVSSTNYGYGDKRSMHEILWPMHYDLGVKHIKIAYWDSTLNWHYVEREKGVYDIDPRTDAAITESVNHGLNVYMTLCYGNWLYTEQGKPPLGWRFWQFPFQKPPVPLTDEYIKAYCNYCCFIVDHFKGRIKYYEIWNEQNIDYSWPPGQVAAFCRLVKAAAPVIRQADPQAKIMLGGVCFMDVDYFEQMFKQGVAEVVDVICWHPYQWEAAPEESYQPAYAKKPADPYPSYRARVAAIKELARKYGFKGNEFHANETTWVSPYPAPNFGVPGGPVSEMVKAKYVARTIALHSDMGIPVYYNETWNCGIVYWDVSLLRATFSADPESPVWPQPAYYALRNLATLTDSAQPCSFAVDVAGLDQPYETCRLKGDDGTLLLGVWLTCRSTDQCPRRTAQIVLRDVVARQVTGLDSINGTEQPLNFETTPQGMIIRDMLITDYPIFIKVTPKP